MTENSHCSDRWVSHDILQLPNELLVLIIKLATLGPRVRRGCHECKFVPSAQCLKELSLVCRQIRRRAQPLLFPFIQIHRRDQLVPPSLPVVQLHRSLPQNRSLRQHCRYVSVSIIYTPVSSKLGDYKVARDLAQWLTRVRCLEVYITKAAAHYYPI